MRDEQRHTPAPPPPSAHACACARAMQAAAAAAPPERCALERIAARQLPSVPFCRAWRTKARISAMLVVWRSHRHG